MSLARRFLTCLAVVCGIIDAGNHPGWESLAWGLYAAYMLYLVTKPGTANVDPAAQYTAPEVTRK